MGFRRSASAEARKKVWRAEQEADKVLDAYGMKPSELALLQSKMSPGSLAKLRQQMVDFNTDLYGRPLDYKDTTDDEGAITGKEYIGKAGMNYGSGLAGYTGPTYDSLMSAYDAKIDKRPGNRLRKKWRAGPSPIYERSSIFGGKHGGNSESLREFQKSWELGSPEMNSGLSLIPGMGLVNNIGNMNQAAMDAKANAAMTPFETALIMAAVAAVGGAAAYGTGAFGAAASAPVAGGVEGAAVGAGGALDAGVTALGTNLGNYAPYAAFTELPAVSGSTAFFGGNLANTGAGALEFAGADGPGFQLPEGYSAGADLPLGSDYGIATPDMFGAPNSLFPASSSMDPGLLSQLGVGEASQMTLAPWADALASGASMADLAPWIQAAQAGASTPGIFDQIKSLYDQYGKPISQANTALNAVTKLTGTGSGTGALSGFTGGGGSGGSGSGGSPEWYSNALQDMYSRGRTIADQPFKAYPGEGVSPLDPNQEKAAQLASSSTGAFQGDLDFARTMNNKASGAFTDVDIASYINPYIKSAIDPVADRLVESSARDRNRRNAMSVSRGAFGGSRQAIEDMMGEQGLNDQIRTLYGQGYSGGFDRGVAQFNADRNNWGSASNRSTDIATTGSNLINNDVNRLSTTGSVRRGALQDKNDFGYKEFIREQGWPMQQFGALTTATGRGPTTGTGAGTGTSGTKPNPWVQGAGALAGLYGATNGFSGFGDALSSGWDTIQGWFS